MNPKKFIIIIFALLFVFTPFVFSQDTNSDCIDENTNENLCRIDTNSSLFNNSNNNTKPDNDKLTKTKDSPKNYCATYFTSIGCPHCAKIDPIVFLDILENKDDFALIEYEVKKNQENAKYAINYNNEFNTGLELPILFLNQNNNYFYQDISKFLKNNLENQKYNNCVFPKGVYPKSETKFNDLNFNQLNGKPTIFKNQRALKKTSNTSIISKKTLHKLLNDSNIDNVLKDLSFKRLDNNSIEYSGGKITYDQALSLNGYNIYFNGECNIDQSKCEMANNQNKDKVQSEKLGLITIVSLAITDAINPCAFAVLLMLLLTITTYNPKNKRKTLYAGLLFVLSVFIMYFLYGLIFVSLFNSLGNISFYVYKGFAIVALILGILQIKDFFNYKPGGFGTEMPLNLRPKLKKIMSKITSPKGAFIIGVFVTLFLLPCTIGPYIIATNSMALLDLVKSAPLLLLYNLIFVLPMLAITIIVYLGIKRVQDIGKWKERNIKYLHLIAGIIIFILGVLMLFGII